MNKMHHKTRGELEHVASLLELNPNPVIEVDYSGKITFSNPATEKALEKLGLTMGDVTFFLPADLNVILKNPEKEEGESSFYREVSIKDRIFEETISLAAQLRVVRIYAHDITERKRTEEERLSHLWVLESMDKVNLAIQGARDLDNMMRNVLDLVLSIFDCDRAFLMYPCDPEAASWRVPMERNRPEYPGVFALGREMSMDEEVAGTLRILLDNDGPVKFGTGHLLPKYLSERFGFKSFLAMAVRPKVGMPWQFGIYQCSYPRVWTPEQERLLQEIGRRLEDALTSLLFQRDLQESERKYRRIIDTTTEGIWVLGPDTMTTFVNAGMAEMLGYQSDEMIGRPLTVFMFEEDVPDHHRKMEARFQGVSEHYERRFRRKDGKIVWTLAAATPIFDDKHNFKGSFAMFTDITESKQAEEALKKNEAFIRNILESVGEGIIVVDREYRIQSANRAFCEFVKMPAAEIVGRHCYEVSHYMDRPCFEVGEQCAVRQMLETGAPQLVTHLHTTRAGGKQYVETKAYPITDASGAVVSAIEILHDVTERKVIEDQFRQAQKMEAVGHLAGGIAHDFNNMLTAIMGYGSLLNSRLGKDSELRPFVDQILSSAGKSANLTRQLLAFSRKQEIAPQETDLNELIKGMEKLSLRLIGEDIELKTQLTDKPLTVMVDPGQIEQVLMNLSTNARDSMPDGGLLSIGTDAVELDESYIKGHDMEKPGKYALMSLTDTGKGMDEKTQQKIFEPFFTTKELGKGTGLG